MNDRRIASLAIGALIVAAIALRIPGIAEPIGIDQGIFGTVAAAINDGMRIYADAWDQKPPGIHLTYAAAFAILGRNASAIFWLDFTAGLITAGLLGLLAAALADRRTGWTAATVFLVGSLPAGRFGYGGFLERAVAETFISLAVTGAAIAAVRSVRRPDRTGPVTLGLLIGAACVYKPTALIYWPALLAWIAWSCRDVRRVIVVSVWSAAGIAVAPVLTLAWLAHTGVLHDAWVAIVEYNRAYAGAGGALAIADRLVHDLWRYVKTDPVWTAGAFALAVATATAVRGKRLEPIPVLCACWLAASTVAIGANGIRMFNSYFMQAVPALALAFTWLVLDFRGFRGTRRGRVAVLTLAFALVATVAVTRGFTSRVIAATAADVAALRDHATGGSAYLDRFGGYATGRGYSARANAELAAFVASHTQPDDRIYIFGMAPSVYVMAGRHPANRFLFAFAAVSNSVSGDTFTVDALVASLRRTPPALLILERNNRDSLLGWRIEREFEKPAVQALLDSYHLIGTIEDFSIYAR